MDTKVTEKDEVELSCEISDPNMKVRWNKDNNPVVQNERIKIKAEGKMHSIIIPWSSVDDTGLYQAVAGFSKSAAKLSSMITS